jgi:uncharacterized membrane protein required for colicin V production
MTRLDWIILGFAAFTAVMGCRRGFVRSACSLLGLAAGAVIGARVAPQFLADGRHSGYTALIGLAGAVAGALVFQTAAVIVGGILRTSLRLAPPLRVLDSAGGLVLGAAWGLALAWVVGAVAVQVPGHADWRRQAHDSHVLHRLNEVAPPRDVLRLRPSLAERLPV